MNKAAILIKEICGGEISKIDIQKIENFKTNIIKFDINLFQKVSGFKIPEKKILSILEDLGFKFKNEKKHLKLIVPSWRPDISQPIDIVEELARINGYDQIKLIEPRKERNKPTLNKLQKLFHFLQRSIATKGYYEAITWSFTDPKYNNFFREKKKEIKIVNPLSSEIGVLRNSIFSNLIFYLHKNLNRDIKDLSLFEIGPIFSGSNPVNKRQQLADYVQEKSLDCLG